jgi:hypothetical protein
LPLQAVFRAEAQKLPPSRPNRLHPRSVFADYRKAANSAGYEALPDAEWPSTFVTLSAAGILIGVSLGQAGIWLEATNVSDDLASTCENNLSRDSPVANGNREIRVWPGCVLLFGCRFDWRPEWTDGRASN